MNEDVFPTEHVCSRECKFQEPSQIGWFISVGHSPLFLVRRYSLGVRVLGSQFLFPQQIFGSNTYCPRKKQICRVVDVTNCYYKLLFGTEV